MGPGTIRLGGIFIFVNIAVTIVGTLVAGALSSEAAKAGQAPQFGVVNVAVMIVQMLLTFFALLATKGLFNANQYRGGDIPILALVVVGAALLLIVLVAGVNPQGLVAGRGGQTAGILGIVLLVLLLIYFVLALIFAITCIKFGGRGGGGLWKATGILYLIAMLIFVVAIVIVEIRTEDGLRRQRPLRRPGGMHVRGLRTRDRVVLVDVVYRIGVWLTHQSTYLGWGGTGAGPRTVNHLRYNVFQVPSPRMRSSVPLTNRTSPVLSRFIPIP